MELFHQFLDLGSKKILQIHNASKIKGFQHKFWEQEMDFSEQEMVSFPYLHSLDLKTSFGIWCLFDPMIPKYVSKIGNGIF